MFDAMQGIESDRAARANQLTPAMGFLGRKCVYRCCEHVCAYHTHTRQRSTVHYFLILAVCVCCGVARSDTVHRIEQLPCENIEKFLNPIMYLCTHTKEFAYDVLCRMSEPCKCRLRTCESPNEARQDLPSSIIGTDMLLAVQSWGTLMYRNTQTHVARLWIQRTVPVYIQLSPTVYRRSRTIPHERGVAAILCTYGHKSPSTHCAAALLKLMSLLYRHQLLRTRKYESFHVPVHLEEDRPPTTHLRHA
jgi:hypothetical protein